MPKQLFLYLEGPGNGVFPSQSLWPNKAPSFQKVTATREESLKNSCLFFQTMLKLKLIEAFFKP